MDLSDPRSSRYTPSRTTDQSPNLPACDECRNRKIKCNRELPKCSNCRKAMVSCDFPTKDKKGSQVKQIANDVATFHDRLSIMEDNLAQRMEMLTDLVSRSMKVQHGWRQSSGPYSSPTPDPCLPDFIDETDEVDESNQAQQGPEVSKRGVIINDGSAERFYGETSTYSLFIYARHRVKEILEQQGNDEPVEIKTCYDDVRRLYDLYDLPSFNQEDFLVDDNAPLELPPRGVLEASIDFYLKNPSIEPALFQQETLSAAVRELYSGNRPRLDESWVLCFNCIILQSMGWVSKIVGSDRPIINGMDDNMMSSLLANANCALAKLDKFSGLRMINVQALFLLALVARDHIHFNMFERTFDRACQIAKQMGLHERTNTGKVLSAGDTERQNVIWLLYLVDKQRIFIRGSTCRLYFFECNLDLPAHRPIAAHLELACILEDIYKYIYSPRADRQKLSVRREQVRRLEKQLESWSARYRPELEIQDAAMGEKAVLQRLHYAWHTTRLLIARKNDESDGKSRLEIARVALQVIKALCGGPYIFDGGLLVLERLFCDYSVVAYCEIFDQYLHQPEITDQSDLSLLTTATSALGLLSHPSRADSYCNRLHKRFIWSTGIATAIHNARELQGKRNLVQILPKPSISSSSSASLGRLHSSPVVQSTLSAHDRNNSWDWSSDTEHTVGHRPVSSQSQSAPQSSLSLYTQGMQDYDDFASSMSTKSDAIGDLDFNYDIWMQQYLDVQDLAMTGTALGQQPMSDFVFNSDTTTNQQMMTDLGQAQESIGHPFTYDV